MSNQIEISFQRNYMVIKLPEYYSFECYSFFWEMINRPKDMLSKIEYEKYNESEYIIIDMSELNSIDQYGAEFTKLAKLLKNKKKELLLCGMPEKFKTIYESVSSNEERMLVLLFNSFNDGVEFVKKQV